MSCLQCYKNPLNHCSKSVVEGELSEEKVFFRVGVWWGGQGSKSLFACLKKIRRAPLRYSRRDWRKSGIEVGAIHMPRTHKCPLTNIKALMSNILNLL